MHRTIQILEAEERSRLIAMRAVPEFHPGDTLRVNVKIREGERERVQAFQGVCIAKAGGGVNENFTVRKISFGEGVERVFPILSPMIESIEVKRRGVVRRAKLYYLRDRRGKSARIAERQTVRLLEPVGAAAGIAAAVRSMGAVLSETSVVENLSESAQPPVRQLIGSPSMATALRTILDHNHAVSGPDVREVVSKVLDRIPDGPVAKADLADVYRNAIALGEHLSPLMFSDDKTVSSEAEAAMLKLARLFFAGIDRKDGDVLARFLRHMDLRLICHLTVKRSKAGADVTFDGRDFVHAVTKERSLLETGPISVQLLDEDVTERKIRDAGSLVIPARGHAQRAHHMQGSTNDLGGRAITVLVEGREVFSTPADHECDVLFVV